MISFFLFLFKQNFQMVDSTNEQLHDVQESEEKQQQADDWDDCLTFTAKSTREYLNYFSVYFSYSYFHEFIFFFDF